MTETGLLIAQVVVVLLLYLVVWLVIRSSARQLRDEDAMPAPWRPAAPEPAIVTPEPEPTEEPVVEAVAPPPPPPPPPPRPALETVIAAERPDETAAGARRERSQPSLDLSANIHPRLFVESGPGLEPGMEVELASGMTIGRGPQNRLAVADAFVSHMHARIFRRGQFLYIEDLGSTNGTFVNEHRIAQEAQLRVRDEIRVGDTILRYEE